MKVINNWDNLPVVLTTEEVAQILCVQASTVRRLVRTEKLKAKKINKKYLFDRDQIKQIIKEVRT